jgi:excisionase family DNA binding protein
METNRIQSTTETPAAEKPSLQKLVFTIPETAGKVGVHPKTIRAELASGRLRCIRIGCRVLIPATELDRYMVEVLEPWSPARIGRGALRA